MRATTVVVFALLLVAGLLQPGTAAAQTGDEAQIRALEDRFAAAVSAKDLDAIMKVYLADETLFVFDVVPPRQYVGAAAYRKDWDDFLKGFDGPLKFELSDVAITVDGTIGFGHSIQRVTGKDPKGQPIDVTVRVTDAYRKINGNWLIVHEHVSVPVDFATGTPDMASKP
jgi:ketosteroid isomerase-like protein